jgi:hypothetical protein
MSSPLIRLLTRQAQGFAAVLGLALLAIANRLWEINQAHASHAPFYPHVWPWWFAIAGILTLMWAVRPDSRILLATSGAFAVSAMVSRAMATILQITEAATVLSSPQLHVAGLVWSGLAAACGYVWLTDFRAVSGLKRHNENWARGSRGYGERYGEYSGEQNGMERGGAG